MHTHKRRVFYNSLNCYLKLLVEFLSNCLSVNILKGKIGMGENLNWKTRVRVALEAAQGIL